MHLSLSLEANRIAAETVADADDRLPDFDVFCAVVEATQDTLLKQYRLRTDRPPNHWSSLRTPVGRQRYHLLALHRLQP